MWHKKVIWFVLVFFFFSCKLIPFLYDFYVYDFHFSVLCMKKIHITDGATTHLLYILHPTNARKLLYIHTSLIPGYKRNTIMHKKNTILPFRFSCEQQAAVHILLHRYRYEQTINHFHNTHTQKRNWKQVKL